MALRKFLYIDADGIATEAVLGADSLQLSELTIASGGDITVSGGGELVGLPATPSTGNAAASKDYVDSVSNGLVWKASCRVRTDGEVDATWTSAGAGVGKTITAPTNSATFNTIDGVALVVGNRVLVADYDGNASDSENGIYEVTALGDGATTSFELTRATDADTDAEVDDGMTTWVGEGTAYSDTRWTLTTNDAITIDTTALQFTQTAGPGTLVGGNGIDITGNTISVDLTTNGGLEFTSTTLNIDADITRGVNTDASGLFVKLAAAGAGTGGIEFDGSGDLQIDLTALPGLELTATGLQALVDGVTIQINGSGELEVIGSGAATRVANTFTADEAVVIGDAIQWSPGTTNDRVVTSDALRTATDRQRTFGVAETAAAAAGNTCTVVSHGIATGVIAGATVGDRYFVQSGGGIGATVPSGNVDIIMVGYSVNATDLFVDVNILGKKVA